jgi:hypothetical protein
MREPNKSLINAALSILWSNYTDAPMPILKEVWQELHNLNCYLNIEAALAEAASYQRDENGDNPVWGQREVDYINIMIYNR